MLVDLTQIELDLSEALAELRWRTNRSAGVSDQRRDKQNSPTGLDFIGLRAEIAFAKALNLYPDLTIAPRRGTPDFIVDGVSFDIKATERTNGRLLATTGKTANSADRYVLGIVSGNTVNFVGWAHSSELIREENLMNLGHGPTYALGQDRLHKLCKEKER